MEVAIVFLHLLLRNGIDSARNRIAKSVLYL